jgi:hypothetical protein
MVVGETHRGRCLVRIVGAGADITLGLRTEEVTVGAVVVDITEAVVAAVVVVVVVVVVVDMDMEIAEEPQEGSTTPHHIRAGTILISMTAAATAQAVVARHEGAVGVEATESLAKVRTRIWPLLCLLSFSIIRCCIYACFCFRVFFPRNPMLENYMEIRARCIKSRVRRVF